MVTPSLSVTTVSLHSNHCHINRKMKKLENDSVKLFCPRTTPAPQSHCPHPQHIPNITLRIAIVLSIHIITRRAKFISRYFLEVVLYIVKSKVTQTTQYSKVKFCNRITEWFNYITWTRSFSYCIKRLRDSGKMWQLTVFQQCYRSILAVWFKLTVTEMTINGNKSNPLTVTVTEKFH